MKIETAMNEIVELIYRMNQRDEISNDAFEMLRDAVEYKGLEKEKQQIVDAYDEGVERNLSFKSGDEFYTQTFNPTQPD